MEESIKQLSDNLDKLCAMIKCTCDKLDEHNKSLEHIVKLLGVNEAEAK